MSRRASLLIIAATYGSSLPLPAFLSGVDDGEGWFAGMLGISCLAIVPICCAQGAWYALVLWYWWANPLLLAGCVLFAIRRDLAARWFGIVAFLLAASFLFVGDLKDLRPGYFLWLGSMASLFVATLLPQPVIPTHKPESIREPDDLLVPV
jgi:hypothetical protein